MRKYLLLVILAITSATAFSQDFSNKGKDFYLCYPQHVWSTNTGLTIWITSDKASSGTITMANGAYSNTFNIPANGLVGIPVPYNAAHIVDGDHNTIIKKSIRVKVDAGKPAIVAYAQQWGAARSAATLLLPTNVLGKKYHAISFNQVGTNNGTGQIARSHFQIIAVKNNTIVEISPVRNGVKGVPFQITLPLAGDMYYFRDDQDLTGTYIESIASASGGCLPIAVFSGSSNITFGTKTCSSGSSYDPLFQQLYPVPTWGKNFGFIPFAKYPAGNPYRIMAGEDNTTVTINGAPVGVLNKGDIYPAEYTPNPSVLTGPTYISADKPICVAQYMQRNACSGQGGTQGDPDMVVLNPIEQNISDITVFSSSQESITEQYVNILMKTIAIPSFRINGLPPTGTWQTFATLPGYSYLRQQFPGAGSYQLKADSGFNAIAYGLGANESYAYSAGTNVKDAFSPGVSTDYGIENSKVCKDLPFKIKLPLKYLADSIKWDISTLPGSPAPVWTYGAPDSTTNNGTIHWYSIPYPAITAVGSYQFVVTTFSPNADGCGTEQDIDIAFEVTAPPVVNFNSVAAPECYLQPVQFNDLSVSTETIYKWYWDFGDPASASNTANTKNASHTFTAPSTPGNYVVRMVNTTTPGCLSDTLTKIFTVPDLPSATLTGNTTVCINDAAPSVTFTGAGGKAEYNFVYTIDAGSGPGAPITVPSVSGIANVSVPTTTAGTYIYTLVSTTNQGAAVCTQNAPAGTSVTVVVRPNATTTLTSAPATANQTVCINNAITPITYSIGGSGTGGTVSFTPAMPGVSGTYAGGVVTITGTPTTANNYTYTVTPVGPCVNPPVSGTISVTPDAAISLQSGPTTQTVCINTPISQVRYGVSGSANGGNVVFTPALPGVTGTYAGGIITIQGTPTTSGTFSFTAEATGPCLPASATAGSIIVTEDATISLTSAAATTSQSVCINTNITNITYSIGGSGTGAGVTFTPPLTGVTGNFAGGVFTLSGAPSSPAGTYSYTVTPTGPCAKPPLSGSITITPDATLSLVAGSKTQSVCEGSLLGNIVYTFSGGATNATVTGLPTGVSYTVVGNTLTISGTPTVPNATPYNFTVNTTGTCVQTSDGGSITVNPKGIILLTSAAATENQTLCQNNAITPITYEVSAGSTSATVTGLPAGVSFTFTPGTPGILTISGTPTVPNTTAYTYNVITSGNTCFQPGATGSIRVNANGVINLASGSGNQEICKNTTLGTIRFNITGGATGATITPALPAGLTGTYSGGVYTIQGTPTVAPAGPVVYTIQTTGSPCLEDNKTITLTINELPTAGFTYSTPNCENLSITFTDASTPNAGTLDQYIWDFGDGPAQTVTTPTIAHTYTTPAVYNVKLISRTDKGCYSAPLTQQVTVSATPAAAFTVPEACISDNVVFPDLSTAAATTPIAQWAWDFGDPASGASNVQVYTTPGNGSHTFATTGPHTVTLEITTSAGCKHTITHPIYINGQPTTGYNITNAAALCSSEPVELTNTSTITDGTILRQEIYWDNIGDPTNFVAEPAPAAGKVYTHKYPTLQTTKTYEIRVRSYSGTTCMDDEIRTITVYATPKVQFNNMPDVCYDAAPFQITQASEIGGVAGTATYTGPGVSSTGIFDPVAAGIGTHIIKYTFTATAAGCIDTLSKTITVRDTASANFTYAPIRCEGSAVAFNSGSSTIPAGAGNITGWEWNFGDPASGASNTSTAANPSHTFATWGNYNVTLRVTSSNGCISTFNLQPVKVDPIPTPFFAFDKASYCIPNAVVTFNNTSSIVSGSTLSHNWQFGDLGTSTQASPTHQYTSEGPFNVLLTVTSAEGCVHDTSIVLNTIHPQPKADFTTSKPAVCIDNPLVTFTDASNGKDGTVVAWNWDFGDGQSDITNPVTHTYATAKDYNVKLYIVNSQGCNSDTLTRVFTVDPLPTVNAGPDRFVLESGQITLQPEVTGTNLSYLWTPNLYMQNNRERNAVVRNPSGDITYRLTVTAKGGCVSSDEVFIRLLKSPKIPNTFTPNNDGINDTWRIDFLNTYPNNRVQVFTRTGQLVFESRGYNTPWDGTLRGKPLPFDTYYYIIEPNNGRDPITGYVTILK